MPLGHRNKCFCPTDGIWSALFRLVCAAEWPCCPSCRPGSGTREIKKRIRRASQLHVASRFGAGANPSIALATAPAQHLPQHLDNASRATIKKVKALRNPRIILTCRPFQASIPLCNALTPAISFAPSPAVPCIFPTGRGANPHDQPLSNVLPVTSRPATSSSRLLGLTCLLTESQISQNAQGCHQV